MEKIKNNFKNIIERIKNSISKFPITIITIFITTIFYAIIVDKDYINNTLILTILNSAILFACGNLLIETVLTKINSKRILLYFLSAVLSIILAIYTIKFEKEFFERFEIFYLIATVLIAIYINFKNSKKEFNNYVTSVAINIFKSSIIYGLLAIGTALITFVFIFLILNGRKYTLILRMEIIICGFYYIPQIIYALYNTDVEFGKFAKVLIKYVLDILVMIAFVIIYIYLAKILILRDIPSNQIFRIIAALFVISCPIWTMTESFNDNKLQDRINKLLPVFFTPFILLQIYSIGTRIINNGLTEARYLCVMLIILEIIYILIYIIKKEKIGKILIILTIFSAIAIIFPYINMYKISEISQYSNLKIYNKKETYTDIEKEKIYGAYTYLKYKSPELIKDSFTDNQIAEIQGFNKYNKDRFKEKDIYWNKFVKEIDVEEYKKVYFIDGPYEYNINDSIDNVFKKVDITYANKHVNIDLRKFITECVNKNDEDVKQYIENNNVIEISSSQKFVITNLNLEYDDEVKYYSIEGYLLEK